PNADAASAAIATGLFIRDASTLRDGSVPSGAGRCWSGVKVSVVSVTMMRPRYAGSATVLSWFSRVEGWPDRRRATRPRTAATYTPGAETGTSEPRHTEHYDRARGNLDRTASTFSPPTWPASDQRPSRP